ncbi:MAG TPA: hypothetical protein VH682_21000 [Gemmataceae bacterium]
MSTLITRKTAKISPANVAMGIARVQRGAAKQCAARTATAQGETGRTRFLAAFLHALSTWTA